MAELTEHTGTQHHQEIPAPAPVRFTRNAVITVLATVALLSIVFSFANITLLGIRLGAPIYLAPLVGPSIDLSVTALHRQVLAGVPRSHLRAARLLLAFCGSATLALNIAEPIASASYGRAAYDALARTLRKIALTGINPMI